MSILTLRRKVLNKMNLSDNIKIYAGILLIALLIIPPVYIAIVSNLESVTADMILISFYLNSLLWIGFFILIILLFVLITREHIQDYQKIWKPIMGMGFSLLLIAITLWQIFGFGHLVSDWSDVNMDLWGGTFILWGTFFGFFLWTILKVDILPEINEAPRLFHWIGLIYLISYGISTVLYGALLATSLPPFFSMIYESLAMIGTVAQIIVGFGLILGGLSVF